MANHNDTSTPGAPPTASDDDVARVVGALVAIDRGG